MMGNVNQVGPTGSLTHEQSGTFNWRDPFTGRSYDIPTFTARTELSPDQQALFDQNTRTQQGLGALAETQTGRLQNTLGRDFSPDSLPGFGTIPGAANLDTSRLQGGPIQSSVAGQQFDTSAAQGGSIQRGVADPTLIDRNARGGQIQRGVQNQTLTNRAAQGGDITRSYGADDFSADRQRVEDALMERMQPHIDRDREAMETRLANQGIGAGARAYGAMQDDFSRGVNDARLGAVLSAGQEQQRMVGMDADRARFQNQAQQQAFGQDASNIQMQNAARQQQLQGDLSRGQFANQAQQQAFGQDMASQQARNATLSQIFGQQLQGAGMQDGQRAQALQEQLAMRNQPINEITALLSGSQVSMPNFQANQPAGIPTTDTAGLINQNFAQRQNNYNSQMAQWNSTMGGLFGMGAAFLGRPG